MNQILDQIMISPCPNASIDKLSQLPLSEISNSEKIKYVNREAIYTLFLSIIFPYFSKQVSYLELRLSFS